MLSFRQTQKNKCLKWNFTSTIFMWHHNVTNSPTYIAWVMICVRIFIGRTTTSLPDETLKVIDGHNSDANVAKYIQPRGCQWVPRVDLHGNGSAHQCPEQTRKTLAVSLIQQTHSKTSTPARKRFNFHN